MVAAFKILTSDHQVKALLVNIFGASLPCITPGSVFRCLSCSVHSVSRACQQVTGRSCLTSRVVRQVVMNELASPVAHAGKLWVRRRHHEVRCHRGRHRQCSKRGCPACCVMLTTGAFLLRTLSRMHSAHDTGASAGCVTEKQSLSSMRNSRVCTPADIPAQAARPAGQVGVKVPLIVRLEGTNVERGKQILQESDVKVVTADDLDDAALKAVASLS